VAVTVTLFYRGFFLPPPFHPAPARRLLSLSSGAAISAQSARFVPLNVEEQRSIGLDRPVAAVERKGSEQGDDYAKKRASATASAAIGSRLPPRTGLLPALPECVSSCQETMADCCFNFRSGIGYVAQRRGNYGTTRDRITRAINEGALCETAGGRGTF